MKTNPHINRALICLALISAGTCLFGLANGYVGLVLASKWLPATLLGLWCFFNLAGVLRICMVAGLWMSALGDITLEGMYISPSAEIPWFAVGLGCFFVAHLFYIALFVQMSRATKVWPLGLMLIYSSGMLWLCLPNIGAMLIPVAAYMLVISVMVWRAACVSLDAPNTDNFLRWLPVAAAVVFALSDSLIAINRFVAPFESARYLILISYWLAQFGIAYTAITWRPSHHS